MMMNKETEKPCFKRPFGLYIHIPFCLRKCNYCSFYSEHYNIEGMAGFLNALHSELEIYAGLLSMRKIKTIYIGGGTPSLLEPLQLERLINDITRYFSFAKEGEITIECNPSSLDRRKIIGLKKLGINRLSLGLQSFHDDELKLLGRLHSSREALEVLESVREEFTNFNLDLIFAQPGQTLAKWDESLKKALSFEPPHLSLYNLEIEEGTVIKERLDRGEIKAVDNQLDAEMYLMARRILLDMGYHHYEIYNFALPGYES